MEQDAQHGYQGSVVLLLPLFSRAKACTGEKPQCQNGTGHSHNVEVRKPLPGALWLPAKTLSNIILQQAKPAEAGRACS